MLVSLRCRFEKHKKFSVLIPTPEREVKSSSSMIYHCHNRGCAPLCLNFISLYFRGPSSLSQPITGGGRSAEKSISFFT